MQRKDTPAEWECQDEKGTTPVYRYFLIIPLLGQTKLSSVEQLLVVVTLHVTFEFLNGLWPTDRGQPQGFLSQEILFSTLQ